MDPERYHRLRDAFAATCDVPKSQRRRRVREACLGDRALERDLIALLEESDAPRLDLERATAIGIEILARPPAGPGGGLHAGSPGRSSPDAGSDPPEMPATIGPYEVLDVLGEGGAGVVYRCVQARPRREVAVKVLRHATPRMRQRFELEMEVLGRLEHPGIARVLEGGVVGREPYIAMELVEGERIDRWADRRGSDPAARVALVEQVCAAVQHAHRHGVVHRDLKPANVIVTDEGRVKVLDFGVARVLDEADTRLATATGLMLGTPAYMSPEQVAGDTSRIDTRSDVYALGVLAFELLLGQLPYDVPADASPSRMIAAVAGGPTVRAGTLERSARGDLETVLGRAMAIDPERRYASPDALAADLERWRRGEPIEARRDSVMYVLRRRLVRSRGVVAAALVGLVATGGFAVHASRQADRAERLAARATTARADAENAERRAVRDRDEAARQRDESQAVTDFLVGVLGMADPDVSRSSDRTTAELLEFAAGTADVAFADRPMAEATVRTAIGQALFGLGRVEAARAQLLRALVLHDGRRELEPAGLDAPPPTDDADRDARLAILWPLIHAMEDLDDDRRWTLGRTAARDLRAGLAGEAPRLAEALEVLDGHRIRELEADPEAAILPILAAAARELPASPARQAAGTDAGIEAEDPGAAAWRRLGDHLVLTAMRPADHSSAHRTTVRLCEQAIAAYERILPHTNTRLTRAAEYRLRSLVVAAGPEAAEAEGRRLMATLESRLGPDHWHLGVIGSHLGHALLTGDRLAEAETTLRLAEKRLASRDAASLRIIVTHQSLIRVLMAQGREADAMEVRDRMMRAIATGPLPQSVARMRVAFGPRHPDLVRAIRDLYRSLVDGDAPRIQDAAERVLAERRTIPLDSPEAAIVADFQGVWIQDLLYRRGPDDLALRFIEDAVRISSVNAWRHPRKRADSWWWLAVHRMEAGRPGEAIDAAEHALAELEAMPFPREDLEHRARSLLGRAWADAGDLERAQPLLRDGFAGLLRTQGRGDPQTLQALIRHLEVEDEVGDVQTLGRAISWLLVPRIESNSGWTTLEWPAWRTVRRRDMPAATVAVALRAAEMAHAAAPEARDTVRLLAAARLRSGDARGATDMLPALLRDDPGAADLAVAALVHAARGTMPDARRMAAAFVAARDAAGETGRAVDPLDDRFLTDSLRQAGLLP